MEGASGTPVFYGYDPQGNLVHRYDPNNDHASISALYDAFGQRLGQYSARDSGEAGVSDPVGFGGQYGNHTDTETGLVLMTHRYYDAGKGRFVNRDPIGYKGGINLYGYCRNNPVNEIDPEGYAGHLYATPARAEGHHIVNYALFQRRSLNIPEATRKVFNNATTGPIENIMPTRHGWSKAHAAYNKAVQTLFDGWISKNKIDLSKMTTQQAEQFIDLVRDSQEPAIHDFLDNIGEHLATHAAATEQRAIAEQVVKTVGRRAGKVLLKRAFRLVGKAMPWTIAAMFAVDWKTGGFAHAANEATWPASLAWTAKGPSADIARKSWQDAARMGMPVGF